MIRPTRANALCQSVQLDWLSRIELDQLARKRERRVSNASQRFGSLGGSSLRHLTPGPPSSPPTFDALGLVGVGVEDHPALLHEHAEVVLEPVEEEPGVVALHTSRGATPRQPLLAPRRPRRGAGARRSPARSRRGPSSRRWRATNGKERRHGEAGAGSPRRAPRGSAAMIVPVIPCALASSPSGSSATSLERPSRP